MNIIKIVVSKDRATFLLDYKWLSAKTLSAQPDEMNEYSYQVRIEFPDHYDINLIAQVLFGAGISYGLDLKYSSYDNEPSRVR